MVLEGKIPGIYYSHDSKESIPFTISKDELVKAQKAETQVYNITVGSKKRNVLFKSVQFHPVTDEIIHVDLYGIKMDQMVSVNISINIVGTAKGVVEGGVLAPGLNEIEIECLPVDIPQPIDIDISDLDIGDSFRVGDIDLEEKLTLKTSEDQIVVSVTQAAKEEEPVVEEIIDEESDEEGTEDSSSEESDTDDSSADKGETEAKE
jgi:large subunit ribosomal protein L25